MVKLVIIIKNKVRIMENLNSKSVNEIMTDNNKLIIAMTTNLFFHVFSSSLQSFAKMIPVGKPASNNNTYSKFNGITYLRKVVF